MSKQTEALKLALVAQRVLEAWDHPHGMPALCQEMNTLRKALAEQPAQQQEPVALDVTIEGDSAKLLAAMLEPVLDEEPIPIRLLVGNGHSGHGLYVAAAEYQDEGAALLVNTSPPASKPWVGLTRDERMSIINRLIGQDWVYAVDAIEAKLKEKNT